MKELEIIRHRQMEGLSLFFDTVEYRTPHFHPEWELIWLTEGMLSIRCGGREHRSGAGDLFFFYPGQVHEFQKIGDGASFLCLQISPRLFADSVPALEQSVPEAPCVNAYFDRESCAQLRSLLMQMTETYLDQSPLYELRCLSLCAELLHRLLSSMPCRRMREDERAQTDQRNARLERFIHFVDENYMHKIRLSDFAEAEGCSTSYISRFIKASLNQNFQDYVNSVRFHSACRLMAAGERKMLDICEESGFSDYRYFSGAFKRQCGLTPEEYSRRMTGIETEPMRRSLHSLERFYSRDESRQLLKRLRLD